MSAHGMVLAPGHYDGDGCLFPAPEHLVPGAGLDDLTVRVCIDADCPNCGYPERWADLDKQAMAAGEPALIQFGCNKCSYRSEERNA